MSAGTRYFVADHYRFAAALAGGWVLSAALRGMHHLAETSTAGDQAWLIQLPDARDARLVLLRDGVPEVDRQVLLDDAGVEMMRRHVRAWRQLSGTTTPLSWWLTTSAPSADVLSQQLGSEGQLERLALQSAWRPSALQPDLEPAPLDPLVHLALMGMRSVDL